MKIAQLNVLEKNFFEFRFSKNVCVIVNKKVSLGLNMFSLIRKLWIWNINDHQHQYLREFAAKKKEQIS